MFSKSMTAYLHASHHGQAVKKICNSRKLAFLYFKNLYFKTFGYFNIFETLWKPFGNPLKASPANIWMFFMFY